MNYQKHTFDLLGVRSTTSSTKGMLRARPKQLLAILAALVVLGLTACGGDTVENRNEQRTIEASGPPLDSTITPEVERFQNSVYNLLYDNCNNCHKLGGQKSDAPFADRNPITAYESALDYFDPSGSRATNVPSSSALVERVSGGHNCWSACADNALEMQTALENWLALETDPNREIDIPTDTPLVEETLVDEEYIVPTPGIEFDASVDVGLFSGANSLHALLQTYCSNCHVPNASPPQQPQAPFFAQADATAAYNELVDYDKVNLNKPDDSQLYIRVAVQQHNCWSDCIENGNEILDLINEWASNRDTSDSVDENLLYSGAMKLGEGQITSGGKRYDTYTIAKWEFKEGADDDPSNDRVAQDSSGVAPFIDLNLNDSVSWVSGYGIEFGPGGKAMSTDPEANKKLHGMILAAGEFSVEAWVVPANTNQQNEANNSINSAVIVSYSFGEQQRNFALGQNLYQYEMYNRINAASSANGDPVFATPGEVLSATLQHVVMTYSVTNGRRFYVNGNPIVCDNPPDLQNDEGYSSVCQPIQGDPGPITNLSQWNPNFFLTLGAETNNRNPWLGQIRFLAIHNKELTEANIKENFDAGVGQKFNLLFNISDIPGINLDGSGNSVARSYIWFEVSEFDGSSYLFSHPQFINLNFNGLDENGQTVPPPTIDFTLKGMRIGVNGKESDVGQAFSNLGKNTSPTEPDPMLRINNNGEPVSLTLLQGQQDTVSYTPADGTVIPKQNGVKFDQFFLTFEEIGGIPDTMVRGTIPGTLPFDYASGDKFVVGVRTFDEINATMAALTGVSAQTVNDEYLVLKGQLPATEAVQGFLSSNQVAIASLAALYCGELVDDADRSVPTGYFGISPDQTRDNAFTGANAGNVDLVSQNLVDKMVNNVATIDAAGIQSELSGLAGYLIASCGANFSAQNGGCNNQARTQAILKSMCTALLSSAVVTHQ